MTGKPAKLRAVREGDSYTIYRGREQITRVSSLEDIVRLAAGQVPAGLGGEDFRYLVGSVETLLEIIAACDNAGSNKKPRGRHGPPG